MSAPPSMEGMRPARGDVDGCMQANRMEGGEHLGGHAECINDAVGGPMDGTGSNGGNAHRRTLPQLSRFGMKVAQEGI